MNINFFRAGFMAMLGASLATSLIFLTLTLLAVGSLKDSLDRAPQEHFLENN